MRRQGQRILPWHADSRRRDALLVTPVRHNLGNGLGFLTNVIQHPYGESDNGFATLPTSTGTAGYIGYVGPIPIPSATQVRARLECKHLH